MKVIRSVKLMQQEILAITPKKIGYVPTMGFFHEGHISLIDTARVENEIVVASIFVNPLQFGPNEDYDTYPRDEAKDIMLAEESGVDILFMPSVESMYPKEMSISMSSSKQSAVLCGRSRTGHFDGVITVLTKLFNIIQPSMVYFGMKDAQQFAIVDTLITDLNFPITLVGLPTIREANGLARSSRNVYLTADETEEATWLYKALIAGNQLVVDGETNPVIIIKEVLTVINTETVGTVDYIELLSYPELQPLADINQQCILAIAVHFNRTRLIDNLLFDSNGSIVKRLG